jgi:hypothetical protein
MNNGITKSNSNRVWKMLILSLLTIAASAKATCLIDSPEIGDTGPGSELVCRQLEGRFASAHLAVLDRTIRSPTEVTVHTSVNGKPVPIQHELIGYTWRPTITGQGIADAPRPEAGLSMRQ